MGEGWEAQRAQPEGEVRPEGPLSQTTHRRAERPGNSDLNCHLVTFKEDISQRELKLRPRFTVARGEGGFVADFSPEELSLECELRSQPLFLCGLWPSRDGFALARQGPTGTGLTTVASRRGLPAE